MEKLIDAIPALIDLVVAGDPVRGVLALYSIICTVAGFLITRALAKELNRAQGDMRSWLVMLLEKMTDPDYQAEVRKLHQELKRRINGGSE